MQLGFPRVRLKKYIYVYKQSQVFVQLSLLDSQGLVEAEAMETVQLSSHSNIPPRSVSSRVSSPLIESVYHLFNFLPGMGQGKGSASSQSVRVRMITVLYFSVLENALFCFPNFSFS